MGDGLTIDDHTRSRFYNIIFNAITKAPAKFLLERHLDLTLISLATIDTHITLDVSRLREDSEPNEH